MAIGKNNFRIYLTQFLKIVYSIYEVVLHWLFGLVYGGPGQNLPPITDLLLLESATSLAYKIRTKKITSVQVLNTFIKRIQDVNSVLNCVVANRFDDARKEAEAVDKLIESNSIPIETLEKEKPFLGVPFTTKDCIAVKGLIHSSGLVKRKHIIAEEDADVVSKLKQAGAIPIALTNVSELCMWWESANKVHGRTSNPYNTNRIVGGSSGGEGCAQAAACSAFGIGSDIGGSIRMPSFFNGIFGHKPSPNIVSIRGQYPKPHTDEQQRSLGLGPMCRRAEDLLPLFKIIVSKQDKLKLDEIVNVAKLDYFYQETDAGSNFISPVQQDIRNLFGKIVQHLKKAHNVHATKLNLERFRKSAPIWFAQMKSPNGPTFKEQLTDLKGTINPYWELVKWTVRMSDYTLIGLATSIVDKCGCEYGDPVYEHLMKERDNLRNELIDKIGENGVFLYPTHPTSAPYHNEPLIKPFNFSYTAVMNVLGLPATHCPMGLDRNGLPIGVQVVAAEGNDRLCLAVANELEKAFGGWVPPYTEI